MQLYSDLSHTRTGLHRYDRRLVHHDAARAIKLSIPRPCFSGDLGDADFYGGQQFGPLVELEIP